MFRHYLISALRNMAANRLQSAIALGGLAIGIATALMMALAIRSQLSFDDFIPGHERLYTGISVMQMMPDQPAGYNDASHFRVADLIRLNIPDVEATTRLLQGDVHLSRGGVTTKESIYWADPNFFDVLPLPPLRGDLATALRQPDGIVMTRSMARKYFGSDGALGQTVLVNGHPMVLRAVVEDFPLNATSLQSGIFASGAASYSGLAALRDPPPGAFLISVNSYIRLKPGTAIAPVQAKAAILIKRLLPKGGMGSYTMPLVRLDQAALLEGLHPGIQARIAVAALIGLLVLFIATANFVNLTVARAARREREVGVRKAAGAARKDLIAQFLGEAVLMVLAATVVGVALCEWLLPAANAFLQSGGDLTVWRDPLFLLGLVAGVLGLGVVTGAYPAFLLSSFRPAAVFKGWSSQAPVGGLVRSGLVILQFIILLCLLIAAAVVFQQRAYAMGERLRVSTDQMLLIRAKCSVKPAPDALPSDSPCWAHSCAMPAFRDELRKLPGVSEALCTSGTLLDGARRTFINFRGKVQLVDVLSTEFGVFGLYGQKPLAGTLPPDRTGELRADAPVVINEAAARRFGLSPAAAVGQTFPLYAFQGPGDVSVRIAAVVPDFSLHDVREVVQPTIYRQGPESQDLLNVRLRGRDIPETLQAIDRLWSTVGDGDATPRTFLSDQMQKLYLSMLREGQLFAIFAGLAVVLACLGLFGLSIAAAERRTKEIGIRKAMGAHDGDILMLLLWQFAKPVLIANLIAWPLAWWAMNHWLNGFAYHVSLSLWLFPAAGVATLLVALITVSGQAILVARRTPVTALRYE